MALNPLYVPDMLLQEGIIDKDTGFPLAAGVITFYSDINRTVLKSVYQITGTPPNYIYNILPNPLTLSSIGTIQDGSGNDVIPYYKPYDTNGNVDLYYITVVSSGGVPQFTREGWPNVTATGGASLNDSLNYVPNGQFYTHNNIVNTTTPNKISQDVTVLAAGGWTYERSTGSTASDFITYVRFNSYTSNPTGDPRYAIRVQCTSPDGADSFKDLRIKFTNVNKFASTTQNYRVFFTAINNGSGNVPVQFNIVKNFGTGGSPSTPETIDISSFPVTNTTYTIYQIAFSFGNNIGKALGTNNDDYVSLAFSFPTNNLFDVSLTDFGLMMDAGSITGFPETPDSAFLYRSIAGFMPDPAFDGSQLYLPLRLTRSGLQFDNSEIGEIIAESNIKNYSSSVSTISNKLLADGAQYRTTDYSPLGIPYSRLQTYYFDTTLQLPLWGTGDNFLTSYANNTTSNMRMTVNKAGAQATATDGTPATNFTFNNIYPGAATAFTSVSITAAGAGALYVITNLVGAATNVIGAGTSGFTIAQVRNSSAVRSLAAVIALAAGGLAGLYFLVSSTTTDYYVWFRVDGVGADPAVGGRTGIRVDLLSTFNAQTVANCVAETLSGFHADNIIFGAGSTVAAGSYFNVTANSVNYYVWYKKDGSGTDPAPAGKTPIQVNILTADTAAQVASKTQAAINSFAFAAPDFRGVFLRGYDPTHVWDLDYTLRWSYVTSIYGAAMGTYELDAILQHLHSAVSVSVSTPNFTFGVTTGATESIPGGADVTTAPASVSTVTTTTIAPTGDSESRPVNAYVNYAIRY